jgi:hypothetical protein
MAATVSLSCDRYFPETGKMGPKGKPQRICIDVRKMQIRGDFITTTGFEVNYLKRNGEFRFYVKSIVKPNKPLWLPLITNTVKVEEAKWEREGNYSQAEFVKWLKARGIHNGESLTISLMTMPPENLEAA